MKTCSNNPPGPNTQKLFLLQQNIEIHNEKQTATNYTKEQGIKLPTTLPKPKTNKAILSTTLHHPKPQYSTAAQTTLTPRAHGHLLNKTKARNI
ncbi:hypothetical protein VIGAN_06012500 [Vigna angularis var. angularis]|uniref:Uncharacterized protein n=1 Tax=Vigna angularis var. angularis TaxID=157739 RepID=A0A0S3S8V0_PHAAN|nr:hypothetical protein VIGAN_06012500 [Vigna angularis var. angularis]